MLPLHPQVVRRFFYERLLNYPFGMVLFITTALADNDLKYYDEGPQR